MAKRTVVPALAQTTSPTFSARTGSDVAAWTDSAGKAVVIWVGGIVLLVAIVVVAIRFKRDSQ